MTNLNVTGVPSFRAGYDPLQIVDNYFIAQKSKFVHPFEQVMEFHQTYNCLITAKPTLPDAANRKLRLDLLKEEYEELLEAEANDDLVEIADALADMQYLIQGHAISYGIPLDAVFNEVHRSNMSKLDENGKPIYREDGKILKSALFSRPDIKSILDAASA